MAPQELPGFYFDPEKNRYFPIKGPIPGSKRQFSSPSTSREVSDQNKRHQAQKVERKKGIKSSKLIYGRELHGRVFVSDRCHRYNFEQEYEKLQASRPLVCKYVGTEFFVDRALEQLYGVFQTPRGLKEAYVLSAGGTDGYISLYEVGNVGQNIDSECMPEPIWPLRTGSDEAWNNTSLASIWRCVEASSSFSSGVSCIRRVGWHWPNADAVSSFQRALVTTLGSGVSGGSLYVLNLTKPLEYGTHALGRRILRIDSFDRTIWTADCNFDGTKAVIGTNLGAVLTNLETRASSWVYRTKSDILSQQFDHSGNIVLCGLRNGAIIAVDVRQKESRCLEVSSRSPPTSTVRKVVRASPFRHEKRSTKQKFETKDTSTSSPFMSSAVCSLVALRSDDQYFLGSSMDGSVKLFDRRLLHRGAIQSYEGHVNSHNHLQLGVNPSETLVLSGGEDCFVRIWSIKSSELIFEEKISNSIISAVCWPQGTDGYPGHTSFCKENPFELNQSRGAWLGSRNGLYGLHVT